MRKDDGYGEGEEDMWRVWSGRRPSAAGVREMGRSMEAKVGERYMAHESRFR